MNLKNNSILLIDKQQFAIQKMPKSYKKRAPLSLVKASAILTEEPIITSFDDLKVNENIPREDQRKAYDLKVGDIVHQQWLV